MRKTKTKSEDASARIELSIKEYNAMVDRINFLEEKNVNLEREQELLIQKMGQSVDALNFLSGAPLIHRLFKWKKMLKETEQYFD
jgi:hypothetical protein